MVLTRSQSCKATKNSMQNIKLTQEDYECANTLMTLKNAGRALPTTPVFPDNVKIGGATHSYELRARVTSANYNIHDDWDTLSDPTWMPWNQRNFN